MTTEEKALLFAMLRVLISLQTTLVAAAHVQLSEAQTEAPSMRDARTATRKSLDMLDDAQRRVAL